MYRFNGADSRLDRTLECIVMITEALKGKKRSLTVTDNAFFQISNTNTTTRSLATLVNHQKRYSLIGTRCVHSQSLINVFLIWQCNSPPKTRRRGTSWCGRWVHMRNTVQMVTPLWRPSKRYCRSPNLVILLTTHAFVRQ